MEYISTTKDIRVPFDRTHVLLRGNIVTRDMIKADTSDKDKMLIKDVPYPMALRICKFSDMEILDCWGDWIFVRCCDDHLILSVYTKVAGEVEKADFELVKDEPVVEETKVEEPVVVEVEHTEEEIADADVTVIPVETDKVDEEKEEEAYQEMLERSSEPTGINVFDMMDDSNEGDTTKPSMEEEKIEVEETVIEESVEVETEETKVEEIGVTDVEEEDLTTTVNEPTVEVVIDEPVAQTTMKIVEQPKEVKSIPVNKKKKHH